MKVKATRIYLEAGSLKGKVLEQEEKPKEFARETFRLFIQNEIVQQDDDYSNLILAQRFKVHPAHFRFNTTFTIEASSRFYVMWIVNQDGDGEKRYQFLFVNNGGDNWSCYAPPRDLSIYDDDPVFDGYVVNHATDPIYPAVMFFPERFAGFMELKKLLVPDELNPLTGLVTSRMTEVRTLALQTKAKLERIIAHTAEDILSTIK